MRCIRQDYLRCLKFIIEAMFTNPAWLVFHRHGLILEKETERH